MTRPQRMKTSFTVFTKSGPAWKAGRVLLMLFKFYVRLNIITFHRLTIQPLNAFETNPQVWSVRLPKSKDKVG